MKTALKTEYPSASGVYRTAENLSLVGRSRYDGLISGRRDYRKVAGDPMDPLATLTATAGPVLWTCDGGAEHIGCGVFDRNQMSTLLISD
jgi:hypothetical protein